MPATITHTFFAKDLYDILPGKITTKLDFDRCKMFSQSTDSLMFYNLFSIIPGKKIRDFQFYFHTHKTQDFFINLLNYVRDVKIDDPDVYSFIVGYISHYVLDSNVHPYIVYKTGMFDKRRPSTYKYNNVHHFMETFLDNDIVRRRLRVNPYKYDFTKYCFDTREFSKKLNKTIDYTFYTTFQVKNMSKIYYKSLKQEKVYFKLLRQDKYGIKKNIYKLIDTFTPRSFYRFEAISYHMPLVDRHNFLNNDHRLWRNPTTYDMTSNESFVDLYLKSLKQAKTLICSTFDFLDGKDVDLEKLFPNVSYLSGSDCDSKKELKYFEF